MKIQKSTIDSNYKLITYDNGVDYIVYHSASWLVGCEVDKTGSALKDKFFTKPKAIADNKKGRDLWEKAQNMRKSAYINKGYTASIRTKVQQMMLGRADALESKALGLMTFER